MYYNSANIVARLNLPNMAYSPEDRIEIYRAAQTGLVQLEKNPERQRKYADFIDFYSDLNEDEVSVYRMRYLVREGEETMGLVNVIKEEGRQQGVQQGVQQGLLEGIEALLEIKFGEQGLHLLSDIEKILDTDRLRQIKEAIKTSRDVQDVENIIWH
jgi:predicted transposase YdaD